MSEPWLLAPAYFDADFCDRTVRIAMSRPVEDVGPELLVNYLGQPCTRISRVRHLDTEEAYPIVDALYECAHVSNDLRFQVELSGEMEAPQFLEYHSTDGGRFDWHRDSEKGDPTGLLQRKLCMVTQLSDPSDYEGGEFQFGEVPSPGSAFLERGSILIFPSTLLHRVTPVTSGLRYSLAASAFGPHWTEQEIRSVAA